MGSKKNKDKNRKSSKNEKIKFSKKHPKLSITLKIGLLVIVLIAVIGLGIVIGMLYGAWGNEFEITQEEVNNVIDGFYNSTRKLSTADTKSQVLEGLMNTPLDSFEFGDNLVAVLASPLISKRATNAKDVGVSRYDLYKQGNKNLKLKYKGYGTIPYPY